MIPAIVHRWRMWWSPSYRLLEQTKTAIGEASEMLEEEFPELADYSSVSGRAVRMQIAGGTFNSLGSPARNVYPEDMPECCRREASIMILENFECEDCGMIWMWTEEDPHED